MISDSISNDIVELDHLELLVVMDNETDTLSSVDEGVPQIPEVAHLSARTPPSRMYEGHECKTVFDQLCCGCHGLSVLVTGRLNDVEHTVLFDVGPYPQYWLDNAKRLNVDLTKIECLFLSHWHFDHSGGFPEIIAAISAARASAGLSDPLIVDLHPDRPDQRGILLPNGEMILLPVEPQIAAMIAGGGTIASHAQAHTLCDGFFFGSGEIERLTEYETGLHGHHTFRGDDAVLDPLIMDERYLVAHVRGRGISVLSACSHAGIVNACLSAQAAFPDIPVDVVLGGYHLAGKVMEQRIEATIEDLNTRVKPRVVAPGHCTGWRAKARLADTFAPGRYAPSVVGTLYRLQAEDT
ncbi:MAG: 7,8-dihydropterin-6-yl-methyl-4-(beta-D-ribofuranosyl)aminobenzene 5'-phosphate synthase [Gammaproteobacteria bacterium]|jgi:7,8-dihydropterin-6-yl-methyl-4-(beta-D-ribofuranosyl)aminobenzene 5'-phosphate synthase